MDKKVNENDKKIELSKLSKVERLGWTPLEKVKPLSIQKHIGKTVRVEWNNKNNNNILIP